MDENELERYLKEHLRIKVEEGWWDDCKHITINLLLKDTVISTEDFPL